MFIIIWATKLKALLTFNYLDFTIVVTVASIILDNSMFRFLGWDRVVMLKSNF